jgi:hypothetical protein
MRSANDTFGQLEPDVHRAYYFDGNDSVIGVMNAWGYHSVFVTPAAAPPNPPRNRASL